MAKTETTKVWLDAKAEEFSEAVQIALLAEREAYEVLKARKADVLAAVKAERSVSGGMEIVGTAYTRWGQWQIIVDREPQAKAKATSRATLADFLAGQQASGRQA